MKHTKRYTGLALTALFAGLLSSCSTNNVQSTNELAIQQFNNGKKVTATQEVATETPQQIAEEDVVLVASAVNEIVVAPKAKTAIKEVAKAQEEATSKAEKQSVKELRKPASPVSAKASGKSQWVALILAGFVGFLGIHRFYLGYIWQGIVQALTFGGCGIWYIVDFVRILLGNLQPKDGSYSKTINF